jgi:hypothetical protein
MSVLNGGERSVSYLVHFIHSKKKKKPVPTEQEAGWAPKCCPCRELHRGLSVAYPNNSTDYSDTLCTHMFWLYRVCRNSRHRTCTVHNNVTALSRVSNRGPNTEHPTSSHPTKQSSKQRNDKLTPWGRVLLEKPTVPQLVKKFHAFYGTQTFITVFTRAASPHPRNVFWKSFLILSSHISPGLQNGLIPSSFPATALYALLLSSIRATYPAQHIPWYDQPKLLGKLLRAHRTRANPYHAPAKCAFYEYFNRKDT